jgi:hypothetical protein
LSDAPLSSIRDVLQQMELLLEPLVRSGDQRRFFHATYLRTTHAFSKEIERGSFRDNEWTERWDVVFASFYLDALERWNRGEGTPAPWTVAFEAAAEAPLIPLRHVLIGINAHVNFDLPQALLAVITDDEFHDPDVVEARSEDHQHADEILAARVPEEDKILWEETDPAALSMLDRALTPFNRLGTKRFLKESRRKVWHNAKVLSAAREKGTPALAAKLAELERLSAARVADLRMPGQVLLKLAVRGFGVVLQPA